MNRLVNLGKLRMLGLVSIVLCGMVMVGCGGEVATESKREVKSNPSPVFNADSAYMFVEKQVEFGARVPNTTEHVECGKYLEQKLKDYSPDVTVQSFKAKAYNGKVLEGNNYIASFNPTNSNRVLLMAHWDSRHIADRDPDAANRNKPVLGANDGGSGVGVLLELARLMKDNPPPIGVDIVLFDLEDYGPTDSYEGSDESWCLGSQYWSKNPHKPGYTANYGILLDMVGDKEATFYIEGFSKHFAESVADRVWNVAKGLGYDNYFVKEEGGYITDDHLFVNKLAGIPSINIVDTRKGRDGSFFADWHTTHDDMRNIDRNTLRAVGDCLIKVIYR